MLTGPQDKNRAERHYLHSRYARRNFSNDSQPAASDRMAGGPAKPPFGAEGHVRIA